MPMNLDSVGSSGEPVERSWTSTDCILYALGVGAGSLDATRLEIEFTTENSTGVAQQVVPTFATIVGAGTRAAEESPVKAVPGAVRSRRVRGSSGSRSVRSIRRCSSTASSRSSSSPRSLLPGA